MYGVCGVFENVLDSLNDWQDNVAMKKAPPPPGKKAPPPPPKNCEGKESMAAPKGNRFWELRSKHGRDRIFSNPIELLAAAHEYFTWVEDNPLKEEKLFNYKGLIVKGEATKMRAMTLTGLWLFLDIVDTTWYVYKELDDFKGVIKTIENIVKTQKFEGAAADLLNANIIARDLGLRDEAGMRHSGAIQVDPLEAVTKQLESNPELAGELADGLTDD